MTTFHLKAPEQLKKHTLEQMRQAAGKGKDRFYPAAAALLTAAACLALVWFAASPRENASPYENTSEISEGNETLTASTGRKTIASLAGSITDNETVIEILRQISNIPYYAKPKADNTPADLVTKIQSIHTLQRPLTDYRISCPYNDYQENGVPLHPRTDMAAVKGTCISPLCEGVVTEAGFKSTLGYYITIDHGEGLISSYAHCNEIFFGVGDNVTMSDTIATVGATGMATGSFLAFSVTQDGTPINPEALFQ